MLLGSHGQGYAASPSFAPSLESCRDFTPVPACSIGLGDPGTKDALSPCETEDLASGVMLRPPPHRTDAEITAELSGLCKEEDKGQDSASPTQTAARWGRWSSLPLACTDNSEQLPFPVRAPEVLAKGKPEAQCLLSSPHHCISTPATHPHTLNWILFLGGSILGQDIRWRLNTEWKGKECSTGLSVC